MINSDTQNLLMQFAYRIASHLEIKGMERVTFSEREGLFDVIMEADIHVWCLLYEFFEAQIERDSIRHNTHLKEEDMFNWQRKDMSSQAQLTEAGKKLIAYCLENKIPIENLFPKN